MSKEELTHELHRFMADVKSTLGHQFNNTDDVLEYDIQGRKCLGTFDDPYFSSISKYKAVASSVKARTLIDINRVSIMDTDSNELSPETLSIAKRKLAEMFQK